MKHVYLKNKSFFNHVPGIAGALFLLLTGITAYGQDTIADYKVQAGPDIDVCEGGIVILNGELGGDATQGVWRGGRGTFHPDRQALNAEYTPSPEETGKTLVLTLVASNPKKKAMPGRDELKVIVNEQPKADAGIDQRVCAGNKVQLNGKVEKKYKSVLWKTNGSGTFDDDKKLDAVYTPSKKDIEGGGLSLEFTVIPQGVCLPVTDALIVMLDPSLDFSLEENITAVDGKPVMVSIISKEIPGKVLWTTTGTGKLSRTDKAETIYTPSAEDLKKKSVVLEVTAGALTGGCETKKSTTIHFGSSK